MADELPCPKALYKTGTRYWTAMTIKTITDKQLAT